jgi:hypothetical protein
MKMSSLSVEGFKDHLWSYIPSHKNPMLIFLPAIIVTVTPGHDISFVVVLAMNTICFSREQRFFIPPSSQVLD